MSLKVYNTLSRMMETFEPVDSPRVGMYTCGPTVYDYAHIGNFRAYVFEDILRRVLRARGFSVTQVMNLTDVDDKTIRGACASGMTLNDYTQKYKDAFFEDLDKLNIERAEFYPAATEHIGDMIDLIKGLFSAGCAYQSDDGSVYFSIKSFPGYGKLARLDMSGLEPGARVAQDEYRKENAADFALWKAWNEDDGDVAWESPWGRGRPGWHIECSAMSMKHLGPCLDIHTGGVDNIFPHHDDEIAQSEAATGRRFSKYWMHCGYLLVDEQKMSKSAGNFYTLRDLLERGFSGRDVRYALISAHYRQSLNFTFDALEGAQGALRRLDEFMGRTHDVIACLSDNKSAGNPDCSDINWVNKARAEFDAALDDDLNIAPALAAMFGMIHAGNRRIDAGTLTLAEAESIMCTLNDFDRVLGVVDASEISAPPDVIKMAVERQDARDARRWEDADRLRERIEQRGWCVRDTTGGFKLKRHPC